MTLPGAETFERASLLAWPGIAVDWDGAWVRRASQGYTKRANSMQCFDPADDGDVVARLGASCEWFEAQGLPPVVRITPLTGPNLRAALDEQGWGEVDQSHLFAMPLGPTEPDRRVTVTAVTDPEFLRVQEVLQGYSPTVAAGMRALLGVFTVPAIGLVLYEDGEPAASALMAVAHGIVVTGNVVTAAAYRRRGLAAAVMRSGLAWAHGQGAGIAALNVAAENTAAHRLYQSMGYAHQYDYVYRVGGASA